MATSTSRAPRTRTAAPKKPTSVALDLDTLEKEGGEPEPYVFAIGGRAGAPPELFFDAVIPEEDQEFFLAQKIPGWKLETLMNSYREHYGLLDAEGN